MGDADKIRVEFDTRVRFQEGQRCVFQYRLVNTGDAPIENLRVWFSAEGEPEKGQKVLILRSGRSSPFLFAWGPPPPGDTALRFVLGIVSPGDEAPVAYIVNLRAGVAATPRETSVSVPIIYNAGQYQVGDTPITVDLGQKTAGPATEGLSLEQGWAVLELFREDTEAQLRFHELKAEKFREMLDTAEMKFEYAVTWGSQGQRDPREVTANAEEAYAAFDGAVEYAAKILGRADCVRQCNKLSDLYATKLPRRGRPPERPMPSQSFLVDEAGGILRRTDGARQLDVWLITRPVVQWGRHSEMDVFLALEPYERPSDESPTRVAKASEAERNYIRSTDISRRPHFVTRWREDGVAVEDRSARGTWLERHGERRRLPNGVPTILANGDRLHLAANYESGEDAALSLEVVFPGLGFRGRSLGDHPTSYAGSGGPIPKSVVFRRLNNRPERQYVLLHGESSVGRNLDSAIVLEGEGIQEQHALVTLVDGSVAVRRLGDGYMAIDGQEVPPGEAVILPDRAEVRIGKVLMEFRRFHPTEKARS